LEDELADGADAADLRARLDAMVARIKQRIETAVNTADAAAVSAEHNKNMVRHQMSVFDPACFYLANSRNTSPKRCRSCSFNVLRRQSAECNKAATVMC